MADGYRNRPWGYRSKRPPQTPFDKPQVVMVGQYTVVFIRDAQIVTMKWRWRGKTYRMKLQRYSVNWKKAVWEARKELEKRRRWQEWMGTAHPAWNTADQDGTVEE